MRDYKKTISDLRNFNANYEANKLTNDAADAIEELLKENAELDNSGRVLMAAFARLKEKVPHWISVEERLPKKKVGGKGYVGYLVLSDGEYQIADFTHDKYMQTAYEFHVDGEYDPNITHWMELPPKEGTE